MADVKALLMSGLINMWLHTVPVVPLDVNGPRDHRRPHSDFLFAQKCDIMIGLISSLKLC